MTVYLNIGSNQGDRRALIEQAVALIADAYPDARLRRSDYIESESWGYVSEHPFLNIGIALDFDTDDVDALGMLDVMQAIEQRVDASPHRNADGTYRDRGIDIDIIAIDDLTIATRRLTVPHPRAHLRPFVMIPLRQLGAPASIPGASLPSPE